MGSSLCGRDRGQELQRFPVVLVDLMRRWNRLANFGLAPIDLNGRVCAPARHRRQHHENRAQLLRVPEIYD